MTGGVYFFPKMLLLTVYFGIKSVQFGSVEKKESLQPGTGVYNSLGQHFTATKPAWKCDSVTGLSHTRTSRLN